MSLLAPVIAVALVMVTGAVVFSLLGYDGPSAIVAIFIEPAINPARWPDLGVKAAPLIIIAVGLSIGFRANAWNIGAEGQYVVGAICGTGVALATWGQEGPWILPAMIVAGIAG
ncbi:MAG: ABC transporter permease, partial [Pseudomonadota bacterium]